MPSGPRLISLVLLAFPLLGCDRLSDLDEALKTADGDSLVKRNRTQLAIGERVPNEAESLVVGSADEPILRGTSAVKSLVMCDDCPFIFKDEERNKSDRVMTARLRKSLLQLSKLVKETWPKLELRVTEAWDDRREHGPGSVHYEGRAADITTSDQDPQKLGTLAVLAVRAGCDWVFYENAAHVHVSVKRDSR
jgi:hypothetical protein